MQAGLKQCSVPLSYTKKLAVRERRACTEGLDAVPFPDHTILDSEPVQLGQVPDLGLICGKAGQPNVPHLRAALCERCMPAIDQGVLSLQAA